MLSDGRRGLGAVGGGDFIEAYLPARRQGRIAKLLLLLAAMLGRCMLVRGPEARLAFRESPLIIGLTGAVALAASMVTVLITAPALRRWAARSTLADHPG